MYKLRPCCFVVPTNYWQERTIKLSAACGLVSCQHLIVVPPERDQAAPRWSLALGSRIRRSENSSRTETVPTHVSSFPFVAGIIVTVHLSHLLIWRNGSGNGGRVVRWAGLGSTVSPRQMCEKLPVTIFHFFHSAATWGPRKGRDPWSQRKS